MKVLHIHHDYQLDLQTYGLDDTNIKLANFYVYKLFAINFSFLL